MYTLGHARRKPIQEARQRQVCAGAVAEIVSSEYHFRLVTGLAVVRIYLAAATVFLAFQSAGFQTVGTPSTYSWKGGMREAKHCVDARARAGASFAPADGESSASEVPLRWRRVPTIVLCASFLQFYRLAHLILSSCRYPNKIALFLLLNFYNTAVLFLPATTLCLLSFSEFHLAERGGTHIKIYNKQAKGRFSIS
ncbi:hypothetical protein EV426DRAFT_183422 [Tirmania nivea]|nr:hypothetical protein EV426DRAFT_183422 [Tirmania nivea]